jgi:hypothetical protein
MNQWEKLKTLYPSQFPPIKDEKWRIPLSFLETFALFQDHIISKQHNSWVYIQTGEKVIKDEIF